MAVGDAVAFASYFLATIVEFDFCQDAAAGFGGR
jgi:hypothetical protein